MSLLKAVKDGNIALVQKLLDDGTDVNIQDNDGSTALTMASTYRHIDIVKLLLNHGANPNIQNFDGGTALMKASLHGRTNIIELLLNRGADPNIQNIRGDTALVWASYYGHTDIVNLLTHHMDIIKIQSRIRGVQIRHKARTQKAYQQISTAQLPVDFDVASMIGDYLSRMSYNPGVARRMVEV